MSWARLDDGFPNHPKVVAAGDDGGWMFVCGLCYACQYLTDGFIPAAQVRKLTNAPDPQAVAERLITVGLWERAEHGYRIHDFLAFNPPGEKVRAEREAARVRMERRRSSGEQPSTPPPIDEANFEEGSAEVPPNNGRSSSPPYPYPYPYPDPVPDPPVLATAANAPPSAAAPPTAEEQELLVALQSLPRWPKAHRERDLAKLRLWRKVYPDRLTRAELCAMESWLTSHPQRAGNQQFVENWLKKPSLNGATHGHDGGRAAAHTPDSGSKARRDAYVVASWTGTHE